MDGALKRIVPRQQAARHLLLGVAALHRQQHAQGMIRGQARHGQRAQAGQLLVGEGLDKLAAVARHAQRHALRKQGGEVRVGMGALHQLA